MPVVLEWALVGVTVPGSPAARSHALTTMARVGSRQGTNPTIEGLTHSAGLSKIGGLHREGHLA